MPFVLGARFAIAVDSANGGLMASTTSSSAGEGRGARRITKLVETLSVPSSICTSSSSVEKTPELSDDSCERSESGGDGGRAGKVSTGSGGLAKGTEVGDGVGADIGSGVLMAGVGVGVGS
jgi:hypothetical protein